jgi:ketosteroid isomerase-like protein
MPVAERGLPRQNWPENGPAQGEEMSRICRATAVSLFALFAGAGLANASEKSVSDAVKACVAGEIAGINAHDAVKATACEVSDTISMESGRPASIGRDNYIAGLKMAFQHEPAWHLRLIEEAVDVPRSGDMAVYRSTYYQDSMISGAPATQKVNFIALLRKQQDGSWKIAWSVVSNIEKPHRL